jgi:hypothetical protein
MILNVGDKVRSQGGVEGEIVALNDDGRSVMVRVPGRWTGTGVVSIPVVRLICIKRYTQKRGSCGSNLL